MCIKNEMQMKLEQAIEAWNEEYQDTPYVIPTVSDEIRNYIKSLPSNVEISVYKRDTPDITKSQIHGLETVQVSEETLPWYQDLPKEEKADVFLERIQISDGITFSDGYQIGYLNNKNGILGHFMLGGEENVRKANELLVQYFGDDESLYWHEDMESFAFTDLQPYIIWYDFNELLTDEAREALYRYIVRMGRKTESFCPVKASKEYMFNCLHNQGSEGFVLGLFYADIAGDDAMMERMEEYLDRCLAHLAASGSNGDLSSPGYGGFTYTNYLAAYNYIGNERMKAKLELLLDWCNMLLVNQIHYPSNGLTGPFTRAYGCQYFNYAEKQDYRTILYLAMDGNFFSGENLSRGYSFWFSNAAALNMYFPDYMENLLKGREYPYEVTATGLVKNDPSQLNQHVGWVVSDKYRLQEKHVYMTEEYALSARAAEWNCSGNSGQDGVVRATWRRNEEGKDIKDVSDIGTLWSMYMYDSDLEYHPDVMNTYLTYNYPNGNGKEFALSNKNKAIVMGWPGLVKDIDDPIAFYKLPVEEWSDMGESILITNYEEARGIWYGDTFLQGEMTVLTVGEEEVRIRLTGEGIPFRTTGAEKIYIEDFNTYISLQPLNTTAVEAGREYDIGITDFGAHCTVGTSSTTQNLLAITAYNYYGEKTAISYEERIRQRNGFIIEMGDKSEYKSMADFVAHMEETSFESFDEEEIWCVKYQSGEDSLELRLDTEKLCVSESYINGSLVRQEDFVYTEEINYKYEEVTDPNTYIKYGTWDTEGYYNYLDYAPFMDCEMLRTNNMVQSTEKEITLGDAVLENPAGSSVLLIHDPIDNIYIFLNLANRTGDFKLTTPEGVVTIEGLNWGRVIYRPNAAEPIETMIVPGITSTPANITVTKAE
ncbi:MAG: hypothetical protein J6B85_01195 [Lachnospiraceae bacterium]|nr:hypothetical protein [Lachnospiraceae bacterium]